MEVSPLLVLSARLVELGRRAARARPRDSTWGGLARSLGMWAITIDRLAESGPAFRIALEVAFPDDPGHGRTLIDPLAQERAQLDVAAFITAGDMLLDDVAAVVFEYLGESTPVEDPWERLMKRLDQEPATEIRSRARELDVLLVGARSRLVAHRRRDHHPILGFQLDGSLQMTLVNPGGRAVALQKLLAVNARLSIPTTNIEFEDVRDWLIGFASQLDGADRRALREAFMLAGFELFPPYWVVRPVLEMLEPIVASQEASRGP